MIRMTYHCVKNRRNWCLTALLLNELTSVFVCVREREREEESKDFSGVLSEIYSSETSQQTIIHKYFLSMMQRKWMMDRKSGKQKFRPIKNKYRDRN